MYGIAQKKAGVRGCVQIYAGTLNLPVGDARRQKGRAMWLTTMEVCDELGIARSTLSDWRAKGRAPRCKKLPNGSVKFKREWIDEWIDSLPEGVLP